MAPPAEDKALVYIAPFPKAVATTLMMAATILVVLDQTIAVVALIWFAASNAVENMHKRGIPTDFSFWDKPASFDINQTLIPYNATSPNSRVFWVGLLNTLLVAGLGVVFATIIGFAVGAARLSVNWLIAKLATIYVEGLRNVPLLLQIIFWYNVVLGSLPNPRNAAPLLGEMPLT